MFSLLSTKLASALHKVRSLVWWTNFDKFCIYLNYLIKFIRITHINTHLMRNWIIIKHLRKIIFIKFWISFCYRSNRYWSLSWWFMVCSASVKLKSLSVCHCFLASLLVHITFTYSWLQSLEHLYHIDLLAASFSREFCSMRLVVFLLSIEIVCVFLGSILMNFYWKDTVSFFLNFIFVPIKINKIKLLKQKSL